VQLQLAAQTLGSFAHSEQSEVTAHFGECFILLEALAIVGHSQTELPVGHGEMDSYLAGVRVLHGVGDGFLCDP
jgi:hypothetical protein